MRPLQGKWFLGFTGTQEDKKSFEQAIRNSTVALTQLTKVLEAEIREAESLSIDGYDNPNWAFKQADRNGVLRTLKRLLTLTKLEGPEV